uniref:WSN domain-containing protein n=1 Tax=Caenorhabditis japonica TaxID=281687 RepID=A0A8R1ELV9_CAEJA
MGCLNRKKNSRQITRNRTATRHMLIHFIEKTTGAFVGKKTVINNFLDMESQRVVEDADKTIKSLARVMNAIALLNEVDKDPTVIKKVIAESLDVRNVNLLDFINQSSVLEVTSAIKSLNSISVQKNNNTAKEILMDLKKIIYNETTPITLLSQTLFSFDKGALFMDFATAPERSLTALKQFVNKLKHPSSEPRSFNDIIKSLWTTSARMQSGSYRFSNIGNLYYFANVLTNLHALSEFDDINIPSLNFDSMITSLGVLESTYDEKSLEVAAFKKSVGQLQDLQFAKLRKKRLLSKLLTSADFFFKSFFEKKLKSETNG